jgi:endonuclease/exonuclease/phosphatase family metal-dependent hydrolase
MVMLSLFLGLAGAADLELEVVTLNTWGLPFPLATARKKRFAKIGDFLHHRPANHFVGLQEVWRSATHLTCDHVNMPHKPHGDAGLGVHTSLDIHHSELFSFDDAVGFDALKTKGWLVSQTEQDGDAMTFVTTHLQAGRGQRASQVRVRQIRQIVEHLAGTSHPVVLMGDFNLHDDLENDLTSAELLTEAGFRDVSPAEPTHNLVLHRLDRVYLRNGSVRQLEAFDAEVMPTGFSDHRPVRVSIRAR